MLIDGYCRMAERLLFERPVALGLLGCAVVLTLLVVWRRRRTRGTARWLIGAAVSWPLSVLLSVAVVTPRERIIQHCLDMARSVEAGDAAAIARHLDDALDAEGLNRAVFVERVETTLSNVRFENVRVGPFDVVLDGASKGVALLGAICGVRSTEIVHDRFVSRWRITFVRRGDEWRVVGVEVVPTPLSPIRSLRRHLD